MQNAVFCCYLTTEREFVSCLVFKLLLRAAKRKSLNSSLLGFVAALFCAFSNPYPRTGYVIVYSLPSLPCCRFYCALIRQIRWSKSVSNDIDHLLSQQSECCLSLRRAYSKRVSRTNCALRIKKCAPRISSGIYYYKHKLTNKLCCFQLVCSNLLLLWIELVHYIIHELLKLCTPKKSLE